MKKKQAGMTLVEIMLVIVIASAIVYMSINQYLSYRHYGDVAQVQANVNTLFQSMSAFYKANCSGTEGELSPQKLDPIRDYPQVLLNIATQLRAEGYLTETLSLNPMVSVVVPPGGEKGYYTQFNLVIPLPERTICVTGVNSAGFPVYSSTCANPTVIGTVVTWKAQVAVHLNSSNVVQLRNYRNLLGADCLSRYTGSGIVPCSISGNAGDYAVWERLPSHSNTGALSNYWGTTPVVSQFTQMYTTEPISKIISSGSDEQYFVCGS